MGSKIESDIDAVERILNKGGKIFMNPIDAKRLSPLIRQRVIESDDIEVGKAVAWADDGSLSMRPKQL